MPKSPEGESKSELPEISFSRVTHVKATGEVFVDITVEGKGIGILKYENGDWRIDREDIQRREHGQWALEKFGMDIFEEACNQARERFPDGKPETSH